MSDNILSIGSISSGTMREEDLIPAFMEALESVDMARATSLRADSDYAKVFTVLDAGLWDSLDRDIASHAKLLDLASCLVNEDLPEALNDYCPSYTYFGSHPGDGADYGVWTDEDSIREAVRDGEIVSVDDLANVEFPKLVLLTNDHGNMTLYSMNLVVEEEIWGIV